jgi:hypothetical protein
MKQLVKILLIFIFGLFLFKVAKAQEIYLKIYDNLHEYAKECNLSKLSEKNLRLYKFPAPYIKWKNNKGYNPNINKIYLYLDDSSKITLQSVSIYQNEFEYMINKPYKENVEKLSKFRIISVSISINDEATYDREIGDPEMFINYFANE